MRKGFKYLLFVACLSGLSVGYAAQDNMNNNPNPAQSTNQPNMSQNTFSNPATTIYVRQNAPEFKLRLPSNPSTGYSWFLKKCDVNLVNVVRHKFYQSQNPQMGAPGYEEWVFRATPAALMAPHITHVVLVYARPTESEQSQDQRRFTIITKQNL
ncbi:MAG: protease inhibitor I42 family protein [Gammaproteobacteria bacterium]